ncbi:MAG: hypothetical protein QW517_09475 [Thermofilaceae archaeon]
MSFVSTLPTNIIKIAFSPLIYDSAQLVEECVIYQTVKKQAEDAVALTELLARAASIPDQVGAVEHVRFILSSSDETVGEEAIYLIKQSSDMVATLEESVKILCLIEALPLYESISLSRPLFDAAMLRETYDKLVTTLATIRTVEDYKDIVLPEDHNRLADSLRFITGFAETLLDKLIEVAQTLQFEYDSRLVAECERMVDELKKATAKLRTVYSYDRVVRENLPLALSRIITQDVNYRIQCWRIQAALLPKLLMLMAAACQQVADRMKREKGVEWSCPSLLEAQLSLTRAASFISQMQDVKGGDILYASIHNLQVFAWNYTFKSLSQIGEALNRLLEAVKTLRGSEQ